MEIKVEQNQQPEFTRLINLASEKLGAKTLSCSDDFFASMENVIKEGRGIFIPDKYTDKGKWMDGWESRRSRREEGFDWVIIQLGAPGAIRGVDIDTNFFLGNHPPHAAVDACDSAEIIPNENEWTEILSKSGILPGSQNFFSISNENKFTHVRLRIYPDGGVARFKVYGEVKKDLKSESENSIVDLAAAENGGLAIRCNDMFFSSMQNLLMPGRGVNMGDGWETKRSRTPGNSDWVIIKLAATGIIAEAIVDTCHFKGNYPDACQLEACFVIGELDPEKAEWKIILPKVKLHADEEHFFIKEIVAHEPVNYVRLRIFPDGGVSRLRLFGAPLSE